MNDIDELAQMDQFNGIRKHIDEKGETWYVVVDVIDVLTATTSPRRYWSDMKQRDKRGELYAVCVQFSTLNSKNNRRYNMDCANREGILRIVQSIPSPRAEPFRRWLAKTGARRLDEVQGDPIEGERERLRLLGFSEREINVRLDGLEVSHRLSTEWDRRGIEADKKEILSDDIHKGAFDGMTRSDHAELKI